jgi:hypothetical protein
MRYYFGNSPEGRAHTLVKESRQYIPVLGAKRVQNYGLLVACLNMLIVGLLIHGENQSSSIWTTLLIVVFATPLHELVHALATLGWGCSDQTVIGLQRSQGLLLPYMYDDGSQPLMRMLLTGLAPLLILTALPALILFVSPRGRKSRDPLPSASGNIANRCLRQPTRFVSPRDRKLLEPLLLAGPHSPLPRMAGNRVVRCPRRPARA